jgi:hypothetical protein
MRVAAIFGSRDNRFGYPGRRPDRRRLGLGYVTYGKRQTKFVPLDAGILLCAYPYFVDGWLWVSIIGVVLLAAPFVIAF